jgi:inner membrane protein
MNVYGIRLLEPFSASWFYGDVLFIIDPLAVALLIFGVWFSLRREKRGQGHGCRPRSASACLPMSPQPGIHPWCGDARVLGDAPYPAGRRRQPAAGLSGRREVLWRNGTDLAAITVDPWLSAGEGRPAKRLDDPHIAAAPMPNPRQAFLFWSRMPLVRTPMTADPANRTSATWARPGRSRVIR